jgi:hypothetical protein
MTGIHTHENKIILKDSAVSECSMLIQEADEWIRFTGPDSLPLHKWIHFNKAITCIY